MFGWIKRIDWFNRRAAKDAIIEHWCADAFAERADILAWIVAKQHAALDTIIAQETPGANATVKRMARIAKEARGK